MDISIILTIQRELCALNVFNPQSKYSKYSSMSVWQNFINDNSELTSSSNVLSAMSILAAS